MSTYRFSKPQDHASSDDTARRARTEERESNEQTAPDEADEKYDTSRMACTD